MSETITVHNMFSTCSAKERDQRPLNQALYVLQTYFRISLKPILTQNKILSESFDIFFAFMLCNFSVRMPTHFCPQKVEKKHPKKCHIYGRWDFFFSVAPTAQNSRLFPFYKFFYPTISGRISGGWQNVELMLYFLTSNQY